MAVPGGDELNFTIHQDLPGDGQTAEPLTVRAIIHHITSRQRAITDIERQFLADFAGARDPGAFIEDRFLQAAIEGGKALRQETYRLGGELDEEGGWIGIHRFLGLWVVNSTHYGEGQELYGPFASRKEADEIFEVAVAWNTPV